MKFSKCLLVFGIILLLGTGCTNDFKSYVLDNIPPKFTYSKSTILYEGETGVSGIPIFSDFSGEFCFEANKESVINIPKRRNFFCFTNQEEASAKLFGGPFDKPKRSENFSGQEVTIRIGEYSLNDGIESVDRAVFLEKIK